MTLHCEQCQKRLSRKTARLIDGKVMCSKCLFPPLKGGMPTRDLGHSIRVRDPD